MAWTRAERWLASGLALLTLTTLATSVMAWRDWRMDRMVKADFVVVNQAVRLYVQAYRRMPLPRDTVLDVRYGQAGETPNAAFFNALRAIPEPGTDVHPLNPDKKSFLDLKPHRRRFSGIDPSGEFLDPWGSPYQVIVDGTGDNICELVDARFGSALGEIVAVWSYGPDREPDTYDDLISWGDD